LRIHLAKVVGFPAQPPAGGDPSTATPGAPQPGQHKPAASQQPEPEPPSDVTPVVRAAFRHRLRGPDHQGARQLDQGRRDFFLYCQKLSLTARTVQHD